MRYPSNFARLLALCLHERRAHLRLPTCAPHCRLRVSCELSGAICLKTLVLLGSALELFRKFFGAVRAFFGFGVLFWLLIDFIKFEVSMQGCLE